MKKITLFFSILMLLVSARFIAQPSDAAIPASSYQTQIGHGFATDWFKQGPWDYNVQQLTDIKNQGFTNVRIRMDSSVYFSDAHFNLLSQVIDDCLAVGLVPIISWLNHTVEDRASTQDKADYIAWWTAVATKLKNKSHKVAFNLFTELGQASPLRQNPALYNSWTLDVYNAIRAISPTRMIVLGSPGKEPDELMNINYTNYNTSPYVMAEWHSYASGPNKSGGSKNWVGTGSASDKQNVINLINLATAFTNASGIRTYVGAWMPMDNANGSLNQSEVESFATYFLQQLTAAGIPSSVNKIDHFYDISTNSWLVTKTWGTTTLNMIPIRNILSSFNTASLPPTAPSSLVATSPNCTSVNLTWSDNSNNESGFNILRSTDGINYTLVQTVASNVGNYSFTNLAGGTSYTYRVNAFNTSGTSANATSNTITTAACPVYYTLSATATNGTVTPSSGSYLQGSNVTLTATPNSGYQFSGWSGDITSTTNPITVTMNSNKNIVANFTLIPVYYTLSATATNGTVTPSSGSYLQGSNVTLTATPNAGYQFSGWSGDITSTTNPITITMNSNKNIVANFTTTTITTTLTPVADAYVRNGTYKNSNFGTTNKLEIKETTTSSAKRITFLKFNLTGITNITNVILQVSNIGFNGNINVYKVASDTWAENTITWNSQPLLGSFVGSFATNGIGTFNVNVTNYVTAESLGDKVVTLALTGVSGENLLTLDSKEGAIAPKLIITRSGSTAKVATNKITTETTEYSIKAYPNPTKENVILRIPNADLQDGTITLYDYSGKEISKTKITSSEMNVKLKGTSGIYIIKISNKGQTIIKRIIKN